MQNSFPNLSFATKNTFRKIEKLTNKKINAENAIAFNQTCLNNDLMPNYTRIKLYDPALQNSTITNEFRTNNAKRN